MSAVEAATWSPVLACRCGRAMAPADMRRLPPLLEGPTSGLVLAPIVCPACKAARDREIAAMNRPVDEHPEDPRPGAPAAWEAPGRTAQSPPRSAARGADPHHHLHRLR